MTMRGKSSLNCTSSASPLSAATWVNRFSSDSRMLDSGTLVGSALTVPDSIFDRSRMSLIRFRRSLPEA